MTTCKECEFYEKYDGLKKPWQGIKAVMRCTSPERKARYLRNYGEYCGFYDNMNGHELCLSRTPKKPKEPERKCKNCFNNPKNNATKKNCWDGRNYGECAINNYKYWIPIPKETEKPKPTIPYEEVPREKRKHYNCKRGTLRDSVEPCLTCLKVGNRYLWEPVEKPKTISPDEYAVRRQAEAMTHEPSVNMKDFLKQSMQAQARQYEQMQAIRMQQASAPVLDLSGLLGMYPTSGQTASYKPKKKENKMRIGIFKFSIRRYMVLCTALVTAQIAIFLNPLVFRFWHTFDLNWNTQVMTKWYGWVCLPWVFTIFSIAFVLGTLWLWNYLSVWVFGEKKS